MKTPNHAIRLLILAFLVTALGACATPTAAPEDTEASEPAVAEIWQPDPAAEARYIELVETAQRDPGAVDFAELRELYIRTHFYQPYAGAEQQFSAGMFRALENRRDGEALNLAARILEENYVSLDAHYVARQVYANRGDQRRRDRHDQTLRALFQVIRASGDGESRATAYRVISSQELNTFISLYGLDMIENELAVDELGPFDRVVAHDPRRDREFEIWFDITPQWTRGFDGF
ncbi:DUF4919 domain-containing protein [Natronospira bacteriovora]|uniref:DUF4919 domain-containing protein n=1 Tax=Natronospira bacteriovora TaxID=3069753 RepID=A0ABU0W6V9_9GAMM|nr:DUF4919 domain-containing protein [Natronospira sp. AB-CW4]MDQ2069770.1 DUF4919 domain-containing protein [Natronospira sp. AB-CW4]